MVKSVSSFGAETAILSACHSFDSGPMKSVFFFWSFLNVVSKTHTNVWLFSFRGLCMMWVHILSSRTHSYWSSWMKMLNLSPSLSCLFPSFLFFLLLCFSSLLELHKEELLLEELEFQHLRISSGISSPSYFSNFFTPPVPVTFFWCISSLYLITVVGFFWFYWISSVLFIW